MLFDGEADDFILDEDGELVLVPDAQEPVLASSIVAFALLIEFEGGVGPVLQVFGAPTDAMLVELQRFLETTSLSLIQH